MASYIYNVFDSLDDVPELKISTTRKYEATKYLKKILEGGDSIQYFEVFRCRDGVADSKTQVDVYEFMRIDMGEVT